MLGNESLTKINTNYQNAFKLGYWKNYLTITNEIDGVGDFTYKSIKKKLLIDGSRNLIGTHHPKV